MKRRVSIDDVAELANTSITSVSRVINDADYPVTTKLRQRILDAVNELNYVPNYAAQKLRSHFSPVIGIIVRDISISYFGDIAKGATDQALKHGYLTFICDTGRNPMNEFEIHDLLWKNRVRGIVLAGGGFDTPDYRKLIEKQIKRSVNFGLKLVATAPQGVNLPWVGIDNSEVIDTSVTHLMENGHRSIAMITGQKTVLTCVEHHTGYKRALARGKIPYIDDFVDFEGFTEPAGYEACTKFINMKSPPTAICCASDLIAVGAARAIHDAGLSVPEDISLIGVGNSTLATYMRPALTTIEVPRYEMGARAIELIMDDKSILKDSLPLITELISRDSVRRLS